MVVPLPDLRHFGVEAADVFVYQVVAIVAAIVVEGLRNLALGFSGDIAPHPTALGGQLRRHRAVGVDGVAAVDKEVRQTHAHGFIDAHAADIGVDAEALADGVAAQTKRILRRAVGALRKWPSHGSLATPVRASLKYTR